MTEFRKPRPSDKMDDHAEQHSHAFDEISNLKGSIEDNKDSIEHNEDRINALEHELDAVAETKSAGEWQLVSPLDFDIRGTGKMTLSNNDLTAPNNELTLHATDLNNVSHGFSGVEVGDLVEVLEEHELLARSTGDYGLYEVKAVNGMSFTLELQQGRGTADTNKKFYVKFFYLSDDVNISELDERYSLKSHTHSYVKSNADTAITPTADNRFVSFKNKRPQEEDGSYEDKEFGLEIYIDEGNTWKNQFQVNSRHGFALKAMGGGGRTTWFGGKITQKGDSLENPDARDYIIRKNLTDAISELPDDYALKGHTHPPQDLTHDHDADYADKTHTHPAPKQPPPGRPFAFGAVTKAGEFYADDLGNLYCNREDLNGIVRVMNTYPDFTWSTPCKITVWNEYGQLKYACEAGQTSDYKDDSMVFKNGKKLFNKGLTAGETYYITVEGYW